MSRSPDPQRPRSPGDTPAAVLARALQGGLLGLRTWRDRGPMTVAQWRSVLRRTQLNFDRNHGLESAAALTYFSGVAFFPIGVTLVSALAVVSRRNGDTPETLLLILEAVAPPALVQGISGPLDELKNLPAPWLGLLIGLALTIWTVSSYAMCFGSALNGFYEVEEGRPFWRLRGTMLLVALPLIVCGAIVAVLTLLTPTVATAVGVTFGIGEPWLTLFQVLKWPAIGFFIVTMLAQLYLWTPNVRRQLVTWISWSAAAAIIGWALASGGFTLYIESVAHYDVVYGSLGGAVVLLIWIYLSNLVLVWGASLDTEMVRMHLLRDGVDATQDIPVPARDGRRAQALARRRVAAERESAALLTPPRVPVPRPHAAHGVYGVPVTREQAGADEPTEDAVEHDFTVPEDADITDDAGR